MESNAELSLALTVGSYRRLTNVGKTRGIAFLFLMCLTIKVFRLVVMYEPFWPRSLKQTPAFHHKNHRDTNLRI